MSTLTSLLARDGVVSLDTIEQALQRQVLEGGELDTALLELAAVPENVLGAYRAASFELPAAARDQIERIEPSLLSRVPLALAREHRVLPIAEEGDTLILATDVPLPLTDVQRLTRELGVRLSFRIGTELRVQVALADHYAIELASRLRLLGERLRDSDPGQLCDVQPWSVRPQAATSKSMQAIERAREPRNERGPRATSSAAVRVLPMVTLGGPPRSQPPAPREVQKSIPAAVPEPPARPSSKPPKRSSIPRGPLTRVQAIELLNQVPDRDRVIDVFFSFARQYFECTVLFALRDERLLGIEGSGLPSTKDLRTVEVSLGRRASVQALMLSRAPRVLDLRTNPADRPLVEAIGRADAQPCAIFPVSIRQRIVSLLYGDRNGELIALAELGDVIAILPAVSGAFERIIHGRKLQAVEARSSSKSVAHPSEVNALPEGTFRPSQIPPPNVTRSFAPPKKVPGRPTAPPAPPATFVPPPMKIPASPTALSMSAPHAPQPMKIMPGRPTAPPAPPVIRESLRPGPNIESVALELGLRDEIPLAPPIPFESLHPVSEDEDELVPDPIRRTDDDLVERPTVQITRESISRDAKSTHEKPKKSASYSQHDVPVDLVEGRGRDHDKTRPERPSRFPRAREESAAASGPVSGPVSGAPADPPPPRTLSQPTPGTGSYAMHGKPAELVSPRALAHASAPPPSAEREQSRSVAAAPAARDLRREDSESAVRPEVVSIGKEAREEWRAPRSEPAPAEQKPIAIDLGAEAERLVEELCGTAPDDERPIVAALLRLGDVALPALKHWFPGPVWFDRHDPRQLVSQGRDVSAIARALFAFEDRALPYIAELLASKEPEVRLCAMLLATDRVSVELLWPLYQRLFDADGQVRLLAFETLPSYRKFEGFSEVQESLREKAENEQEPILTRVSALEAISVLRDPGSVELLAKLSNHANRQLSVPARRSVIAITGHDFGDSERKWKNWFAKNEGRHRIEWLIDGLMHTDERVRNIAGIELQKLTQVYFGFVASASKRERERSQRRYRDWWKAEGKSLF